jgi:hypothetical protein
MLRASYKGKKLRVVSRNTNYLFFLDVFPIPTNSPEVKDKNWRKKKPKIKLRFFCENSGTRHITCGSSDTIKAKM